VLEPARVLIEVDLGGEMAVGLRSDHPRRDGMAELPEPVPQHGGKFEFDLLLIFRFIGTEYQEHGLALPLRPVQVAIVAELAEIMHAQHRMDQHIDGERVLKQQKRVSGVRRLPARPPPEPVGQFDQRAQQARIIEPPQQVFILDRKSGRQRAELAAKIL
jgi:hypothetical protein